jgi:hypothetical protein
MRTYVRANKPCTDEILWPLRTDEAALGPQPLHRERDAHATITERTAYLIEFFRTRPCADCGQSDPLVLEFDHLGPKNFNVAAGLRDRNWQSVLDEIAICDVVCANCHRRRTALRAGFARAVVAQR